MMSDANINAAWSEWNKKGADWAARCDKGTLQPCDGGRVDLTVCMRRRH